MMMGNTNRYLLGQYESVHRSYSNIVKRCRDFFIQKNWEVTVHGKKGHIKNLSFKNMHFGVCLFELFEFPNTVF